MAAASPSNKSKRDEFAASTMDALAKRVGMNCSNPKCRQPTSGPRSDISKAVNIGVAAHITAASIRGARYNERLSSAERIAASNGIWLCQNCAKLVDNDAARFTVALLNDWKQKAESRALSRMAGMSSSAPEIAALVALKHTSISIGIGQHLYRLEVTVTNLTASPLEGYHIDLAFPAIAVTSPKDHPLYVAARSTQEFAFFRYVAVARKHAIYPGDSPALITLDYEMNDLLFQQRAHLYRMPVLASLYCGLDLPFLAEIPFGKLQRY
jgi:hypothetical protein